MYSKLTGVIFLIIAILHALRVVYNWGAMIGGTEIPMWASWAAIIVAGWLAYLGLTKK